MSFWWVNHKQTSKVEIEEGYIWSPKLRKNGTQSETYTNLTRTKPLDIVFSYAGGRIGAVGVVNKSFVESSRPDRAGYSSQQWNEDGWLVPITWLPLTNPIVPKKYLQEIGTLLPTKHSPIQQNGDGNQAVYLAAISYELGIALLSILEELNASANSQVQSIQNEVQEEMVELVLGTRPISKTFRDQIIKARVGQGLFRMEVEKIEKACRWTGVEDKNFLIASHIKPWKDSNDREKLDGHNGLLLSPHVDKLFDKGYISFDDTGKILRSRNMKDPILIYWKLDPQKTVGRFTDRQQDYLEYHRSHVFDQKLKLISV